MAYDSEQSDRRRPADWRTPLKLENVPGVFAVCRLEPDAVWTVPPDAGFVSITQTDRELSIVCEESIAPAGAQVEPGWKCVRVAGSIPFETIGLLASLTQPLADARVSVFAVSTFDTDYLMVKSDCLERAMDVLRAAGFGQIEK
jgi:hypothetical protein